MEKELKILRELASQYFEYAMSDENFRKMELHRASNDLKTGTRPVVLLNEIPWHELEPAEELRPVCQDPILREVEGHIRRTLFQKKYFPGDMVIAPYIGVRKIVLDENMGLKPVYTAVDRKSENDVQAHQFETQFHSMEDVEKIPFTKLHYDREATMQHYERVADALADIVPVKLTGMYAVMGINSTPWDLLAQYMNMDDLLYNMYDEPELMHALVSRLTDVFVDQMHQYEALGVLEGDSYDLHCTPALTNDLHPDRDRVKLDQVWGRAAAQILGFVSPDMHDEFDITYQIRAMQPFGLVYYGCCEALHQKIDIVSKIPNLRKIGVTPWADTDVAIEAISGRYVVSAKANPGLVAERNMDMAAISGEIEKYVDACHRYGCTCDLVLKDITTVSGRTQNLVEWEQTAMRIAQKY
ncbi:MAG: hypothetical protein E7458_06340 [Ruminococcaceae bacterium]|nr:hypothetical protein [Oscillospiraceae bacterium]